MFPTLALSGALQLLAAVGFAAAARTFVRRARASPDPRPIAATAVWWGGVAVYEAAHGVQFLLAAFDAASFPVFLAIRYGSIVVICAAVGALAYHIAFLLTGSRRGGPAILTLYALYAVGFVAFAVFNGPYGITVGPWGADLLYAKSSEGWPVAVVLALLLAPPLAGTIAYVLVAARADDRGLRVRATVLAATLVVWLSSAASARIAGDGFALLLARPMLGLVAASLVVLVYGPAEPLRAWLASVSADMSREATSLRARDLV